MTEKKKPEETAVDEHRRTRREAIKRLGLLGAAAAGIAALTKPQKANAADPAKPCYSRHVYNSGYMSTSVGIGSKRHSYDSFNCP
jgi:hypothetical protein